MHQDFQILNTAATAPFRVVCGHPVHCQITDGFLGYDRDIGSEEFATAIAAGIDAYEKQQRAGGDDADATYYVIGANGEPAFFALGEHGTPEEPEHTPADEDDGIPF